MIDTYYVIKDLLRQLFSPKTPTNDLPSKDGGYGAMKKLSMRSLWFVT